MTAISWKTPISDVFTNAADWNGGVVPGASDDALLTVAGSAYTVTISSNPTVNSLQTASNATALIGANTNLQLTNGTGSGANAGQIVVSNNDILYIGGAFNNTSAVAGGGVVLNGAANFTEIRLIGPTTTFTGGGSIVFATSGNNYIFGNAGSANTLDNVNNTFSGVGNIGDNQMTLNNEAAGVINANQTSALTLQVNGGVTNTGLLEATNTGGLFIQGTSITNTGGTIKATGAGAHVDLQSATIVGGTLQSGVGAQIDVVANQTSYLNGSTSPVTLSAGSTLNLNNHTFIYLSGTLVNDGTSSLNGAANATELRLKTSTTTLTGGGQIVFGTGGNNYILGDAGAVNTLVNVNNTISGVGNVGDGGMTLVNQTAGVINANQVNALTLNVNGGVTNTGILEATNSGGLLIASTGIDNSGGGNAGKIKATVSGAHVDLQASTITGGTFSAVAGAQIDVVANQVATLDGSLPGTPVTIATGTTFNVNNNSILYLEGSIVNNGTIDLLGVANASELRLVTPVTTLTGSGKIVMGTAGNNFIFGNGGNLNELDNVNNTISGSGNIGDGSMTLVNELAGVVNANQAGQLTVQDNGGVVNKGLLEATSTGGLFILNTGVDNTQHANGGAIKAIGAGAHVDLQNSTTITGGVLTTSGTGAMIDVVSGQNAYFDGSGNGDPINIAAGSTIVVNNNAALHIKGTINNAGAINVGADAGANATGLRLYGATVTLTGGGVVNLSNSANNYITVDNNASETLNVFNQTIQGSGNIGEGNMTLAVGALGVIDANQAPGASGSGEPGQLILQVSGGVTNSGAYREHGRARRHGRRRSVHLEHQHPQPCERQDRGGRHGHRRGHRRSSERLFHWRHVYCFRRAVGAPSKFEIVSGQSTTLDGSLYSIGLQGNFNVLNNSTLVLKGAINVSTAINLMGAANITVLTVGSNNVTLTGVGQIKMSNSANNVITSNGSFQDLFNVDDTFIGAGNIGNSTNLQLTNETRGVIDANQTTALTLQLSRTLENYGLIESNTTVSGAGGLFILNTNIDNTEANENNVLNTGKITASGTGHIDLQNSNIYGGTLTSSGTAFFDVVSGQAAGLNGTVLGQAVNIAAGTQFNVNNNANLYLYGAINNAGTITLSGTANNSILYLNSSVVSLTGGGQVVLGGAGLNFILQNQANAELDNVSNTISGSGKIGNGGAMTLVNELAGTIDATAAGGFAINLGGVQMNNFGTLVATGGPITVTNSVFNTGRIIADGGNVTISGNVNGAGTELISGASTLEIGSSVGGLAAQTVQFAESGRGGFDRVVQAGQRPVLHRLRRGLGDWRHPRSG